MLSKVMEKTMKTTVKEIGLCVEKSNIAGWPSADIWELGW